MADVKQGPRPYVEWVVVIALLAVLVWMRAYKLDADPPTGLSSSTDVYTDPPQYTLFSRLDIETGSFNPYHDNRFVFFLRSSVTAVSWLVFKAFGVSTWSSDLVGLFFSFGSLIFFYLFIRRISDFYTGLILLLLLGLNYNLLFYGKLPFLEHAMTFFGFLSLLLLVWGRGVLTAVVAGASLAAGIFFGKVIGIIFLFTFFCYFGYEYLFGERKRAITRFLAFAAGFTMITVFWLLFSYLPMKRQVTSYLGEQAFSLYGAPEGFESFDNFVWKLVSFGDQSKLFERMIYPAIMGAVFLAAFFFYLTRRQSWKSGFGWFTSGHVSLAALIIGFYGALMVWNYRPLRYQLVLIYAFYGAAALVLRRMFRPHTGLPEARLPVLWAVFIFPLILVPFYKVYGAYIEMVEGEFFYEDHKWLVALASMGLTGLIVWLVSAYRRGKLPLWSGLSKVFAILIILGVVYKGVMDYEYWWERPSFSARDDSRDLALILSPSAVVSGPFGPGLGLETDYGTIIHMFGVSKPDTTLFARLPVTHLLIDEGNEDRANEDYPGMMDSAVHILTYHVGLKKVRLYRIAGHTGNPAAEAYRLSLFEVLQEQYRKDSTHIDRQLAIELVKENPDNMSGYLLLGETANADKYYDLAETMFKKAVEFSPTNYNLNARLGKFYQDWDAEAHDARLKEAGLFYYRQALKFAPSVGSIETAIRELEGS